MMKALVTILLAGFAMNIAIASDFCGYSYTTGPDAKSPTLIAPTPLGWANKTANDYNTRIKAFDTAAANCDDSKCFRTRSNGPGSCLLYFKTLVAACETAKSDESDVKHKNKKSGKKAIDNIETARTNCINGYQLLRSNTWPSGFTDRKAADDAAFMGAHAREIQGCDNAPANPYSSCGCRNYYKQASQDPTSTPVWLFGASRTGKGDHTFLSKWLNAQANQIINTQIKPNCPAFNAQKFWEPESFGCAALPRETQNQLNNYFKCLSNIN